jgi:hypothetical protein
VATTVAAKAGIGANERAAAISATDEILKAFPTLMCSPSYRTTRLAVADAAPVTSVAVTVTMYVPRGVF